MNPIVERLARFRRRAGLGLGVGLAALVMALVAELAAARGWLGGGLVAQFSTPAALPDDPVLVPPTIETPPAAVVLYSEPLPEDFRPEYDRDAANRAVQPWDDYWRWVQTYYRGNFLAGGWAVEARASFDRVADPTARRELIALLNDLGRLASREWAKDRGRRRITTDDVKAWGRRLDQARRDEDGTGASLVPALHAIRAEAEAKLTPGGGS